ncbi:hypothetical protein [Paraburkholderia sp. 40]|uniref:hypothetical protein n=1 Tax=unclassified Paraburkholderia TaxID=2615204 RepID=UPI003D229473
MTNSYKKSGKSTAFGKSDSLARQGSLAGNAGAGLILLRNPAMDRLVTSPDKWISDWACASKRARCTDVDKLSEKLPG